MIDLTYLKNTTGDDSGLISELIGIFASQLPEFKESIENVNFKYPFQCIEKNINLWSKCQNI